MRWLFAFALFLPTSAWAEARIDVRIDFSSYRVTPEPSMTHNHIVLVFTLRDDGTVGREFQEHGPKARSGKSETKLGDGLHVADSNTLVRKIDHRDHVNTLTIVVSGKSCRATMTNELKPGFASFEARSTKLGTTAGYRDWRMISSTCRIQ